MNEGESQGAQEQSGGGLWRIIYWSAGFLVVYILSTGPVLKFCPLGSQKLIAVVYMPLAVVTSNVTFVKGFFKWYLDDFWKIGRRSEKG